MMRGFLLAFSLVCVGANVVELTESNFDDLTSEGTWILEFFAPWCGHCKALAPKYAAAAEQLEGKVFLGAINCDNEKGLATRFGVRGYPTLKFYQDGDAQDYKGQRSEEDIVKFALRMIEPPVKEASTDEELGAFLEKNDVVFGFLSSEDEPPSSAKDLFYATAKKNKASLAFAAIPSVSHIPSTYLPENAQPDEDDDAATFVVALTIDGPGHMLHYPYSEESLQEFISANNLPLVATLSTDNFGYVMRLGKRLVIAAIDPNNKDANSQYLTWLRDVSRRRKFAASLDSNAAQQEDFVFLSIDGDRWSSWVGQFVEAPFPKLFVHDYALGQHFLPSEDGPGITGPEGIEKFLKDVESGKAATHGYRWYNPLLYLMMLARWKQQTMSDRTFNILLAVMIIGIGVVILYTCPDGEEVLDDDMPAASSAGSASSSVSNERSNTETKKRRKPKKA